MVPTESVISPLSLFFSYIGSGNSFPSSNITNLHSFKIEVQIPYRTGPERGVPSVNATVCLMQSFMQH